MSTPGPMEQSGGFPVPIGYAEATQVAQNAFEGGLIDVNELDRRLAVIAQSSSEADAWESVRDLRSESLNNTQQSKKRNSVNWVELGMSIPWYVACVATLVCRNLGFSRSDVWPYSLLAAMDVYSVDCHICGAFCR